MDIDLTGQDTIKHEYEVHFLTKVLKVTFKDSADTVLGTIEIEEAKYRPLLDALRTVANQMYDDWAEGIQRHRSSFRILDKKGETVLFP